MSRPVSAALEYADAALERWARWGRDATSGLGWPAATILARVIEQGFTGAAQSGAPEPVDDLVDATEKAVLALSPPHRAVVVRAYTHREPPEASARSMRIPPADFSRKLHQARRQVGWYLQGWAQSHGRVLS